METIYISYIDGDDNNSGTREKPVRTMVVALELAKLNTHLVHCINYCNESSGWICVNCQHEKRRDDESIEPYHEINSE